MPSQSILVVDDEPLICSGTVRLLRDAGYTVHAAQSGLEALAIARAQRPDLILLDVVLPDMDGIDVCRQLKEDPDTAGIFISMVSAHRTHREEQAAGLESGADDYIARPVGNRELLARVNAMLRLKHVEAELARHRDHLADLVAQRTAELKKEVFKSQQAEKAVIQSERKYRSLINEMGNGFALHEIICDETGAPCDYRFLEVNKAFEAMTRLSADAVVGKTVLGVRPDTERHWIDAYGKVALEGQPCRFEYASLESGEHFEVLAFSPQRGQFATVLTDVTHRKKAERALKESEQLLERAQEITNLGSYRIDHCASRMEWSNQLYHIFGYAPGAVQPDFDLVLRHIHPDDRPRFIEANRQHLSGLQAYDETFRLIRHDGAVRTVFAKARLERNAAGDPIRTIGIVQDISDRLKADQSLHEITQLNERIISESPVGMAIYNAESGRCLAANEAIADLVGAALDQVLVQNFYSIDSWKASGLLDVAQQALAHNQKEHCTADLVTTFGKALVIDCNLVPIEFGGTRHLLLTATDITRRVRAEEEKQRMESSLRQSQKMESIGTMAGGIAHEFNNLLGVIIGNAELAIDDVPSWNPAEDCLREILAASLRAKDVVRGILTFARKLPAQPQPVCIGPVVIDALKLLRATLPSIIEIRPAIQCTTETIMADPTELHQVMMNICNNAVHAMGEKAGVLEVGLEAIHLDPQSVKSYDGLSPGGHVRLRVTDTGCGIASENLTRVLDPYFTTKSVDEGLGMGLAIVYGIIKKYHGAIHIESDPGKGTRVDVLLPLIDRADGEDLSANDAIEKDQPCILFVDDEPALVKMATRILAENGYRIEGHTSSMKALAAFKARPDRYDLVMTDMTMPEMMGDDLARAMLALRHDLPVVLCTGHNDRLDVVKSQKLSICSYALKPLDKAQLLNTVRGALRLVQPTE